MSVCLVFDLGRSGLRPGNEVRKHSDGPHRPLSSSAHRTSLRDHGLHVSRTALHRPRDRKSNERIGIRVQLAEFRRKARPPKESLEIIRKLWASDFVSYNGEHYTLTDVNLYTKPKGHIAIYVAADGPKAAVLVGQYGDGLATIDRVMSRFGELWKIIDQSAKDAGRDPANISRNIELFISYDRDYEQALGSIRKWKFMLIPNILSLRIHDPRELERRGQEDPDSELTNSWTIATSGEDLIRKAEEAIAVGFNEIEFHSSSPSEQEFIGVCGKEVLPYLREKHG